MVAEATYGCMDAAGRVSAPYGRSGSGARQIKQRVPIAANRLALALLSGVSPGQRLVENLLGNLHDVCVSSTAPHRDKLPVYVKGEFGEFYKAMFDEQVRKENMRSVFLEYAWDMSWCDPCARTPCPATS